MQGGVQKDAKDIGVWPHLGTELKSLPQSWNDKYSTPPLPRALLGVQENICDQSQASSCCLLPCRLPRGAAPRLQVRAAASAEMNAEDTGGC